VVAFDAEVKFGFRVQLYSVLRSGRRMSFFELVGLPGLFCAGMFAFGVQLRHRRGRPEGAIVPRWLPAASGLEAFTVFAVAVFAAVSAYILVPVILTAAALWVSGGIGRADIKIPDNALFTLMIAADAAALWVINVVRQFFCEGDSSFLNTFFKPRDFRSRGFRSWFDAWGPFVCFLTALVLTLPLSAGIQQLGKLLKEISGNSWGLNEPQEIVEMISRHHGELLFMPLVFVSVCVAAPLAEEVFFRGILYPYFKRLAGMWPAALLTGLLFGAAHMSISAFLPLTVFGAYLCIVYEKNGYLAAPAAIHALFNALSLLLSFLGIE
jgi:membrane protease YdiL (CAAX protease family)